MTTHFYFPGEGSWMHNITGIYIYCSIIITGFCHWISTFAVDFVLVEVEFSTFAAKFVGCAVQLVTLAQSFVALAIKLDAFAIELGVCFRIHWICTRMTARIIMETSSCFMILSNTTVIYKVIIHVLQLLLQHSQLVTQNKLISLTDCL